MLTFLFKIAVPLNDVLNESTPHYHEHRSRGVRERSRAGYYSSYSNTQAP
jgi:hypothetical protein